MPNIENLKKIKAWLEDGAPHVRFSMITGLVVERDRVGRGECGTTCCIGGAAHMMANGFEPGVLGENGHERLGWNDEAWRWGSGTVIKYDWFSVRDSAAEWLGLTPLDVNAEPRMSSPFPLFDSTLAPTCCTPQEAAQAIQNVIDGREHDCWLGIRDGFGPGYQDYCP